MKILIADDERISRVTLRSMISEINLPLQIIGEAADGEDMVKKIDTLHPALVIADIRMPKLSGLEAIRKAKEKASDIQWIILTGFSKFEYAKESIDLGVCRYLLKPVNPEELKATLEEIYLQYRHECDNNNRNFQNDLMNIQYGLEDSSLCCTQYACFTGLGFHIDCPDSSCLQKKIIENIRVYIEELSNKNENIAILSHNDTDFVMVIACHIKYININSIKDSMIVEFKKCVHSVIGAAFIITGIELPIYKHLSLLMQDLEILWDLFKVRIAYQYGKQMLLKDAKIYAENKEILHICEILHDLQLFYRKRDYFNFTKQISKFEASLYKHNLINTELKTNMSYFLIESMNCKVDPSTPFRQWIIQLRRHGEDILIQNSHNVESIIEKVKKYIDQNYMYEISISEVSDMLHITPNYLSSLFHKETGITFTKYLTNTRMIKAKELLMNLGKVKNVANSVGYTNTKYFSKVFKSYFYYYPSEFAEKFKVTIKMSTPK